jgi:hypothetical protein
VEIMEPGERADDDPGEHPWERDAAAVAGELQTDPERGLTAAEAARRLGS